MGAQRSNKGFEYINVQIIDPSPQGWLGHHPVYEEQEEGDESEKVIDFAQTPVIPMARYQAEKLINRGQAVESKHKPKPKPQRKKTEAPDNKSAAAPQNK